MTIALEGVGKPLLQDIAAVGRIEAVPTILRVVSEFTGLRLALVARVTEDSWTACAVLDRMEFGLQVGSQLEVATTLCSEVRDSHEPIIIEHASEEPEFCSHPTPRMYGFESYVAFPIFRTNGEYFGNLCALDAEPARLRDGRTPQMLTLFADLISRQLNAEEALRQNQEALRRERQTAALREQFIAVLGHDLRNPLSSIITGSEFLLSCELGEKQRQVMQRILSSGERMAHLVDDLLDMARGRLGGGLPIAAEDVDVAALLHEVVDEVAGANPDCTVNVAPADAGTAQVDRDRLAQMLSNLVANAVSYCRAGEPVEVSVAGDHERIVFTVANWGDPIPGDVIPRLFDPYVRADTHGSHGGLGLGLYIAAEIAHAHDGEIRCDSTPEGRTTFTVELPRLRPAD